MSLTRRTLLGLMATVACGSPGLAALNRSVPGLEHPVCDAGSADLAIADAREWDAVYEARWGPLGRQTREQIADVLHDKGGQYDDSDAVFAWIVHYWIRAWVKMAQLTGRTTYMDTCVDFIDTMFDRTDAKRVARGEITESYVREPGYFRGTGRGGPFWKCSNEASVLVNGQIIQGILWFVDAVYADARWKAYRKKADQYFTGAKLVVDMFDNDWQSIDNKGSYHYRDSAGTGMLGVTAVAFNQAATMMTAQILINKWEPSPARLDKIRRLVHTWLEDYMVKRPDGTLIWRYIANHPTLTAIEDVGHANIDVGFLVAAFLTGETALRHHHMMGLAKTYLDHVQIDGLHLNKFIDGTTEIGFNENWNAGVDLIELARFDSEVVDVAVSIYNRSYPQNSLGGVLWARPMLGWANLISMQGPCSRS